MSYSTTPADPSSIGAGQSKTWWCEPLATCELFDRYEERARVPAIAFQVFGRARHYHGPAVTVKCFEDNSIVRDLCHSQGNGRVLVVDGSGSLRCALVGGIPWRPGDLVFADQDGVVVLDAGVDLGA